jgi:XRE family aerobic/anaerobic benzoate catabolism transcriptional regulator
MDDLRGILSGRAPFYAKADFHLDTSARPLAETFEALRRLVRRALALPDAAAATTRPAGTEQNMQQTA